MIEIDNVIAIRTEHKSIINRIDSSRKESVELLKEQEAKYRDEEYRFEGLKRKTESQRADLNTATDKEITSHRITIRDIELKYLRQLAFSNIRNHYPHEFEMDSRDAESRGIVEEQVIWTHPLVAIIARYVSNTGRYNSKPVNKIDYSVKVYFHKDMNQWLRDIEGHYTAWDTRYLIEKSFPTVEAAKKYHERNSAKYIEPAIANLTAFTQEIDNTTSNFEHLFDFRYLTEPYLNRHHSGDNSFKILKTEKSILTLDDGITITLEGNRFIIAGPPSLDINPRASEGWDYSPRAQILGAIETEFNLHKIN